MVATNATDRKFLNLTKRMNLIGVFGSSGKRRALIRFKSGKFVKVRVGEKLDGGRVVEISKSSMTYRKRNKDYVLRLKN